MGMGGGMSKNGGGLLVSHGGIQCVCAIVQQSTLIGGNVVEVWNAIIAWHGSSCS